MAEKAGHERQSDIAFKMIKEAIINGRFKPGDILQEQEMIELFKLGRTPIREALQKLSVVGLVKSIPHKGVMVAIMSKDDVKDIYEIRCNLDSFAAGLAASRASESEIAELESLINSPNFKEESKGYYDESLHKAIYKASHNKELIKILNDLYEKSVCMFSIGGLEREQLSNMKNELSEIITAIKAHDVEAASKAALAHVKSRDWF